MNNEPRNQAGRDSIQADGDVTQIGGDQFGGSKITNYYLPSSPPANKRERRNRTIMLQKVHDFWIAAVLENSLRQAVLIALDMRYQQAALADPRNLHLQRSLVGTSDAAPPRVSGGGHAAARHVL
jgi:hypothetical protein